MFYPLQLNQPHWYGVSRLFEFEFAVSDPTETVIRFRQSLQHSYPTTRIWFIDFAWFRQFHPLFFPKNVKIQWMKLIPNKKSANVSYKPPFRGGFPAMALHGVPTAAPQGPCLPSLRPRPGPWRLVRVSKMARWWIWRMIYGDFMDLKDDFMDLNGEIMNFHGCDVKCGVWIFSGTFHGF